MCKNKLLLFFVCIALAITVTFVFSSCENEETNPYIENLNSEITLNKDGSILVKEAHAVVFEDRGRSWWNYYKVISSDDSGKGNSGVTETDLSDLVVKVDGKEYPINGNLAYSTDLNNISDDGINSEKETSYSVKTNGGDYEIGVIMPQFESGKHVIEFTYKLTDMTLEYNDCDGFYYQFIGRNNTLFVKNFSGKVNFAEPVGSADDIKVWTHIEGGNAANRLDKESLSSVSYVGEDINESVYLETRILFLDGGYTSKKINNMTSEEIIREETKWKEDFEKKIRTLRTFRILDILLGVCFIAAGVLLSLWYLKKTKRIVFDDKPEYIRDVPNGYTAGEMVPLYQYYKTKDVADGISATILDLHRRKYIKIEVGEKAKQAKISLNTEKGDDALFGNRFSDIQIENLKPHERTVWKMLSSVQKNVGGSFTMKQMEKIAEKESAKFGKYISDYEKQTEKKTEDMGCYRTFVKGKRTIENISKFFIVGSLIALVFSAFGLSEFIHGLVCWVFALGMFLSGVIMCVVLRKRKIPLTGIGQKEYDNFDAFAKFMTEFSNFNDKEIPELELWEEYMIYATGMGIADKVSKQLEIRYPQYREFYEKAYANGYADRYTILYLCSPRVRTSSGFVINNSVRNMNAGVQRAITASKMASIAKTSNIGRGGFGGGGGFSGGGGGFSGGGMGSR